MSLRTPKADGLTISPNAVADANNPAASVAELQAHRFWGRFATAEALPNASGNAATNPAYNLMRPGDVAWVQADGLLYQLQDRGTLSGSDATWAVVGGGGAAEPTAIDFLLPGSTVDPVELFRWNKTDLTQFDTGNPLVFRDDLNLPVAGSITPAVSVGAGRRGENWLTFTSVGGFKGGYVFRLLDDQGAPLALPQRYWVYTRYARGPASGQPGGIVIPFGIESPSFPGYVEGVLATDGYVGGNSYPSFCLHSVGGTTQPRLFTGTYTPDIQFFNYPSPGAAALDVERIGGVESLNQVRRQDGENPTANWWWRRQFRTSTGSDQPFYRVGHQMVRSGVSGGADPTSWNGLVMDQAFVGAYVFNASTGHVCAYSDIRIFAWNPDAPGT